MSRAFRITLVVIAVLAGLVFLLSSAIIAPIEAVWHLLTGWVTWPLAVFPQARVSWPAIATGLASVALLVLVADRTLRSLMARHERAWRTSDTLRATGGLGLMFVVTMASAGIAHQGAWLAAEPVVTSRYRSARFLCHRLHNLETAAMAADVVQIAPGRVVLIVRDERRSAAICVLEGTTWRHEGTIPSIQLTDELANLAAGLPAFLPEE